MRETASRLGPRTKSASASRQPTTFEQFGFGAEGEVDRRNGRGMYADVGIDVEGDSLTPPVFNAIKPETNSGRTLNRAALQRRGGRSGDDPYKWGSKP